MVFKRDIGIRDAKIHFRGITVYRIQNNTWSTNSNFYRFVF